VALSRTLTSCAVVEQKPRYGTAHMLQNITVAMMKILGYFVVKAETTNTHIRIAGCD